MALVVMLGATACGGDGAGDSSAAPSAESGRSDGEGEDTAEAADRDAEFRYAASWSFNTLDPHKIRGATDALYARQIYDRLLTVSNKLEDGDIAGVELQPMLATAWQTSVDGMSLEFELRDDVTFQDGTTFDAAAAKANLDRARGPDSTVKSELASVESVEVVDPTHIVLHLTTPDPSIPWAMAYGTSGMMVSPTAFDTDLTANPVGSGPFRVVSAQKDAEVVLERWDGHWDPDAALVRRLTITSINDANVRLNGVRSGEYDAGFQTSPNDVVAKGFVKDGFHWVQALSPVTNGVLLNSKMAPFDDVRVRRAVSLAVNREEISEELLDGVQPPAYQPFQKGFLGYDPALDENPYDPAEAKQLIEEAGATGATVRIIQNTSQPENSMAAVIQEALSTAGLDVELVPVGATEARAAWRQGGYHGFVGAIIAQVEPTQTLNLSYLAIDNPAPPPSELVTMAREAQALPVGSAEREEAYQEMARYMMENPVHVPLTQFSTVNLARPNVVGSDRLWDIGRLDFRGVGIKAS